MGKNSRAQYQREYRARKRNEAAAQAEQHQEVADEVPFLVMEAAMAEEGVAEQTRVDGPNRRQVLQLT
jgi:hypothetical protein